MIIDVVSREILHFYQRFLTFSPYLEGFFAGIYRVVLPRGIFSSLPYPNCVQDLFYHPKGVKVDIFDYWQCVYPNNLHMTY